MQKVYVRQRSSYSYPELRADIFGIFQSLGHAPIKPGMRVLIKPNILTAARPEQAITTHPNIIKAVAEYVIEHGARPVISDSPAIGTFERALRVCGISDALKGMPVELAELKASRQVNATGPYGTIELSAGALDADLLINLPKLKTHIQMGLTLAVKNLFGCIVGTRKPEWHFKAGEDKERFAELLASIYGVLRPGINLMDGILGMEGEGPGTSGRPRHIGVLLASTDALAVDMAATRMLGLTPEELLTTAAAIRLGLGSADIEIEGVLPHVGAFDIPATKDVIFGPRMIRGFIRHQMASRPQNDSTICILCGDCAKICPAKAIVMKDRKLVFDYDKCIRCYCCIEVCPRAAMFKRDTLLKKTVERILMRGR